jgi:heme exporter protein C
MQTISEAGGIGRGGELAGQLLEVSPQALYGFAGRCLPWLAAAALACGAAGLYVAFFVAPADARQGEVSRILFAHVPAAWMSLFLYFILGGLAAAGVFLNARLPAMLASALAPTGALLTFLALWTGAIWGKPNWGAWWVWDARLTCELMLLFLYLGFMALGAVIDDRRRADRAAALFGVAGAVALPILYFSLQWWNALHQGTWASAMRSPGTAAAMLAGMVLMTLALFLYSLAATLSRVRSEILERDHASDWVLAQIGEPA